jgi:hypothetical protein
VQCAEDLGTMIGAVVRILQQPHPHRLAPSIRYPFQIGLAQAAHAVQNLPIGPLADRARRVAGRKVVCIEFGKIGQVQQASEPVVLGVGHVHQLVAK